MIRYKGSEIIKKVEDKEIKHGATIKSDDGDIFIYSAEDSTFYWEKRVGGERVPIYTFLNHTFELIEDNTIDIDNINLDKIIKVFEDIEMCLDRLSVKISSAGQGSIDNYLDRYKYDLQAVKQLNKELKEK